MHTALVWPNLGLHISPPIGVVCMKFQKCRQIKPKQCCVCCITSGIHIIFRTWAWCDWVGVTLVKGLAKFASLVQVNNFTWIHSKNTILSRMPPRWGMVKLVRKFTWLLIWNKIYITFKRQLAASIAQLSWFCYIWVKCICVGMRVLIWSTGGV